MADAGYAAILLTFAVSLYAAVTAFLGARRPTTALLPSARNGILITAASSTLAVGLLLLSLLQHNYAVKYVYEHTSAYLPTVYTISALWAGQEGSLLVWLWFVVLLSTLIVLRQHARPAALSPYALATLACVQAFLALTLLMASNPFAQFPIAPAEGSGLNPLLQNVWMVMHPPIVFLGYAAYCVPFALTLSRLITGKFDKAWLETMRRWALWAWLFLGAGILMGAWWAYLELGWGGYWGWDPVESSSLIPWLTGTALLHALMMQRRKGTYKKWVLWLAALTFELCLFATFVTRSGFIQSVHAFEQSSLGYYFLAFILLSLAVVAYLLHRRRQALAGSQDPRMLLSQEASLWLTNLLFVGAAAVILLGTLFPALVELIQGRQASLDTGFYQRTFGPLAQIIVLLIGLCPWLPWGGITTAKLWRRLVPGAAAALITAVLVFVLGAGQGPAVLSFAIAAFVLVSIIAVIYRDVEARRRNKGENPLRALGTLAVSSHRRYGSHLVHLGIVLIGIGVVGSTAYQQEVQVSLAPGEKVDFAGYTVQYRQPFSQENDLYYRVGTELDISRGSRPISTVRPVKDLYQSTEQWVTEVAIHSTLKEDLYVILASVEQDGLASFRLLLNPLVIWLWIGGAIMLLGGLVAWWPSGSGEREA